jgi:hypothetical protein
MKNRQPSSTLKELRDWVIETEGVDVIRSLVNDFHDKYHKHPGALECECDEAWNIIGDIADDIADGKTNSFKSRVALALAVEIIEPTIEAVT